MDERALTERLITYDTSNVDGLRAAAGFIKGWLEAREIDVVDHKFADLHALSAAVGPPEERPGDARLPRPLRRGARPRRSSSSRAWRATGCSAAAATT